MKKNYLFTTLVVIATFYANIISAQNTQLGTRLVNLTTGNWNTAVGVNALRNIRNGTFNTATAQDALRGCIACTYNAAYGWGAQATWTSGTNGTLNTALGFSALIVNTSSYNTATGSQALYFNLGGFYNTANGLNSLEYNRNGIGNSASGYESLFSNEAGNYNTANGYHSLYANTTGGNRNTASGYASLYQNTTGSYNTAVGFQSLYSNISGSGNTALGNNANVSLGNLTNATAIGNNALVNSDNKVVIGRNMMDMTIGGYAEWSNFSDGRFKENVKEDVPGLKFISKLHPVTYTINTKRLDEHITKYLPDSMKAKAMQKKEDYSRAATKIQTGFVAQEVEKTAKRLGYNFDGVNVPKNPTDNYSIAYSQFVMPLVKTVQELAKMNTEKDIKITSIQKQLDDLRKLALSIYPKN